jgi:hypothetical protein
MSFAKPKKRRELGSFCLSGYRLGWRSYEWTPFLPPASNFAKAVGDGLAMDIASDQPAEPGVLELAIANTKYAGRRYKVYIAAADSLRDAAKRLAFDGGEVHGFLDHALK